MKNPRVLLFMTAAAGLSLGAPATGSADGVPPAGAALPAMTSAAVAVDFYTGSKLTASCSGTLLSPTVVLTAGHCAWGSDSGRVTGLGATSSVSRILFYGYDPSLKVGQQQDLAAVLLRSPISVPGYATLQPKACFGCEVVAAYREERAATNTRIRWTPTMRLAREPDPAVPLAMKAPSAHGDSGGGVFLAGAPGQLVGVALGDTPDGAASYVTRLDDSNTQAWVTMVLSYRPADTPAGATSGGH